MDIVALKNSFKEYTERMTLIRRLSSPAIHSDDNVFAYSNRLRGNFQRIGELAAINRKMLDEELYPLLRSAGTLDDDLSEELEGFAEALLSIASEEEEFENLDLPITSLISERLLLDAEKKMDICKRIRMMDAELNACYSMMNMIQRITTHPGLCKVYKDRGLALANEFISLLDKDTIIIIPDMECRRIVLTDARFSASFYERSTGDENDNRCNLELLNMMMEIAEDDFYHDAVSDFNWDYFKFRVYEYYLQCTDILNERGFNESQLAFIADKADEMEKFIEAKKSFVSDIPGAGTCPAIIARSRYLAGRIDLKEYRGILLDSYHSRGKEDFSVDGGYLNILIPLEILCTIDAENLSAPESFLLQELYNGISAYLFHIPSTGTMSFLLEFLTKIIERYVEVPGGTYFEDFVMECIAAIHPPTFIHSRMVGQITERLCYHLLKYEPERFIGMPGLNTLEDVRRERGRIRLFAYHSALCHDVGKISIIDTILVYGRKLLDLEFQIIKSHPVMGARLLSAHSSTGDYADVALLHHRWYDDKGGYPAENLSADSPYKTVIDLVLCADCMDAATDTIGRSYSSGKTLSDYMKELKEGAGTRYAPWLPALFEKPGVFDDIEFLLKEGRRVNYEETYNLLKQVQDMG